jgi:hypothetical protein
MNAKQTLPTIATSVLLGSAHLLCPAHRYICIALTRFFMRMTYGSAKCADPRSTEATSVLLGSAHFALPYVIRIKNLVRAMHIYLCAGRIGPSNEHLVVDIHALLRI